MKNYRLCDH